MRLAHDTGALEEEAIRHACAGQEPGEVDAGHSLGLSYGWTTKIDHWFDQHDAAFPLRPPAGFWD
jgi:hypothetical protein